MSETILKLIGNGKPVYLRVTSAISLRTSNPKVRREMMDAINLMTGESCCIVADTVLRNTLRAAYPNNGYVQRDFEVKKYSPQGGKRYATFDVKEIRLLSADESSQNAITAKKYEVGQLGEVGFLQNRSEYADYRQSMLWRKIRRRVLKRDGNACRRCGGRATTVHHRSYAVAVMVGIDDGNLASVCDGCHNFIHFDDAGRERSPNETDRLLLLRDESTQFPPPKVDLRLKRPRHPSGWERMSAVQRSAWTREYMRLFYLHSLRLGGNPHVVRRFLHEFGMDERTIDIAVSELRKRKAKKRTP